MMVLLQVQRAPSSREELVLESLEEDGVWPSTSLCKFSSPGGQATLWWSGEGVNNQGSCSEILRRKAKQEVRRGGWIFLSVKCLNKEWRVSGRWVRGDELSGLVPVLSLLHAYSISVFHGGVTTFCSLPQSTMLNTHHSHLNMIT